MPEVASETKTFICARCGEKQRNTAYPVYTSELVSDDSRIDFCRTCSNYYTHLWGDGVRRTFTEYSGDDDDDDDNGYGDIDDAAIDEYGSGGARCTKIGRSISGLCDCGFELEFLSAKHSDDEEVENVALKLKDVSRDYLASVEYDGSLERGGAEAVTHYGPLDKMLEAADSVCGVLHKKRCRSHNTSCCGLHVSISRDDCSTYNIARFVVFWNSPKNKEFLEAFARRWNTGYCKPKVEKSSMPAKSEPFSHLVFNTDRYELVNLQNRHRIEIRAFRGTTKATTAQACISLCVWLMAYCKTDGQLVFNDFLEWCKTAEQSRGKTTFKPTEILEYWAAFQERKHAKSSST